MGRALPGPIGRSGHPCRSSRPTAGVAARRRLYKQFLLRNERDVRALFAQRLAADGVAQHAEAALDFLVDGTLLRAVTLGMVDAAEFCERTADALAALVHSSRQSDATDSRS